MAYGVLGAKRIPLSVCAYTAIRKKFPVGKDEEHEGFEISVGHVYEFVCILFRTDNLNCFRQVDHGGQDGDAARTRIRD